VVAPKIARKTVTSSTYLWPVQRRNEEALVRMMFGEPRVPPVRVEQTRPRIERVRIVDIVQSNPSPSAIALDPVDLLRCFIAPRINPKAGRLRPPRSEEFQAGIPEMEQQAFILKCAISNTGLPTAPRREHSHFPNCASEIRRR